MSDPKRTCTQCNKRYPASEFLEGQGRCKACRAARAKAHREKQRAGVPKQKPGPKRRTTSSAPPPTSPRANSSADPSIDFAEALSQFRGRDALEAHLRSQLATVCAYYDVVLKQYEDQHAIATEDRLPREAAKATDGLRATIKDKDASLQRLMKQFKLLNELNTPKDTDPKYAPIHFTLVACPPPEALVEKKFHILPEDVQEGQKVTP